MQINVLLFGITRDIVGENSLDFSVAENTSVASLKQQLVAQFHELGNYGYAVAVNEMYADNSTILEENDTVALIPPVSGG